MTQTITLIEGDGIGPEISAQVVRVLQALQLPLTFDRQTLGQTALEQTGSLIPEATLQSIRKNHNARRRLVRASAASTSSCVWRLTCTRTSGQPVRWKA